MIERKVPRDMSSYESKLLGPLTTRQVVCLVPGAIVAILAYLAFDDSLGESALLVSTILALPFGLCGLYKPFDIPFERFAKTAFYSIISSFIKKKYKSENTCNVWFDTKESATHHESKRKTKNKKKGEAEPTIQTDGDTSPQKA